MKPKRLIIVGGVAGGASAAARARRLCESCEITIFERGPHVSFANCGLPYFVGGEIAEADSLLVQTPESLRARFNLDVRVLTEVLSIDRTAREVRVRDGTSGREYTQGYDALVLSTGAAPLKPPIGWLMANVENRHGSLVSFSTSEHRSTRSALAPGAVQPR